jgi:membrane protein
MLQKIFTSLSDHFRRGMRILTASANSFVEDDCYTKASVLTFYTLQFIVPFLALVLGIAKGFGFDLYLENLITTTFNEPKEVTNNLIQVALSMLQHSSEEVIVGIGVVFLIYANINLFSYIESTLNYIWKIKIQRSFFRKFNDYLAIVIMCPLIFIASSSLTVYLKTQIAYLPWYPLYETLNFLFEVLFRIVPLVLSWLLFFLIYFLLPNAKFRVWPRIVAAILAGSVFQLWQVIFINFQIQLFNYSVVYGSFAIFPLLLIWLQFSWLIALGGAEIAAAIENVVFYRTDEAKGNIKKINFVQVGFLILYHCLQAFYSTQSPLSDVQIALKLNIPLDLTRKILEILVKGNVLATVEIKSGVVGYLPLTDPQRFTIKTIKDILTDFHVEIAVEDSEPLRQISDILNNLDHVVENSEANMKLTALFSEK